MKTLFVPSVREKNGTGHLKRCLVLAEQLSRGGEECFFFLSLSEEKGKALIELFPTLDMYPVYFSNNGISEKPDRIIMDNRETTFGEWLSWEETAPLIFLDEGGPARKYASCLIDTLPNLSSHKPNVQGSPLFSTPDIKEREKNEGLSVLVTFGGEDPAELTEPVMKMLLERQKRVPGIIGVVRGPLAKRIDSHGSAILYDNPDSLESLYPKYDLVITSFGLTPYEAERAGCEVILVNPSSYHEKLTRKAGFLSAGTGKKGIKRLEKLIGGKCRDSVLASSPGKELTQIAEILGTMGTAPFAGCPLCGRRGNPVLERWEDRSFYYCSECHNYYLVNWKREEEKYDREYFFSRYKAQYGKTYLEDFDNIKDMGRERLKEIRRYLPVSAGKKPLLTDLGCAFGPFLAAAMEEGFECRGVEINEDGARWIEEKLKIPVIRGSLEDRGVIRQLQENPGQVTTLWYVIEHMPDQDTLLRFLNNSMEKGGLLAFGTPSGRGISARKNLYGFLEASPADHYVIYTPRGARSVLKRHGFKTVRVKSVGHHPERFGSWVGKKGSFTYNVFLLVSRCFSLGDSLEVYAVKRTD